jgi:prevent-host-death family protein
LLQARATRKPAANTGATGWTLRAAKSRFSELVRLAQKQPQRVSCRGKDSVVVISVAEYERLRRRRQPGASLVEFLKKAKFGELDLERRTDINRDIEL